MVKQFGHPIIARRNCDLPSSPVQPTKAIGTLQSYGFRSLGPDSHTPGLGAAFWITLHHQRHPT